MESTSLVKSSDKYYTKICLLHLANRTDKAIPLMGHSDKRSPVLQLAQTCTIFSFVTAQEHTIMVIYLCLSSNPITLDLKTSICALIVQTNNISTTTFYNKIFCTALFSLRWWVYWYESFSVFEHIAKMTKFWWNIRGFSPILGISC